MAHSVIAGLCPAIHALLAVQRKDVDARNKTGQDEKRYPRPRFTRVGST